MAKYRLVTRCAWAGTEIYHRVYGDFENEEDALEAFGGEEEAQEQANRDHRPEFYMEEL